MANYCNYNYDPSICVPVQYSRCVKYRECVCVCELFSPNGTSCRHLAIAQRLYCHLTRRLRHAHRPNESWKMSIDERTPKTKMKKLFPLFAICCFRSVDNCFMCLCACASFACGNFVQQKGQTEEAQREIPNKWRIIASIWLVFCLFIVRDALLIRTSIHPIQLCYSLSVCSLCSLVRLCALWTNFICVTGRYASTLSFTSEFECRFAVAIQWTCCLCYKHHSMVARSVPKLNRIIFFCTPIIIIIYLVSSSVVGWCQGMPCAAHWSRGRNVFIYALTKLDWKR